MKKPLYDPEELQNDREYVLKKLGLSEEEFDEIMNLPIKSHLDYPNSQWIYKQVSRIERLINLPWT